MARPPYPLHCVVAEKVEKVTPRMRRVTVDGSCLAAYREALPAQWLKVFVPGEREDALEGRAYTIRRLDPTTRALEIDFVLHDAGPVSDWVSSAKPGDAFEISDPHPRSGVLLEARHRHCILFGDETALPAIASVLRALQPGVRADVFVEIAEASEEQKIDTKARLNIQWLPRIGRGVDSALVSAAKASPAPGLEAMVFAAAESSIVRAIRRIAVHDWNVAREDLHAAGYWKYGEADHKGE